MEYFFTTKSNINMNVNVKFTIGKKYFVTEKETGSHRYSMINNNGTITNLSYKLFNPCFTSVYEFRKEKLKNIL